MSAVWPSLRFVASPDESAAVLYDLQQSDDGTGGTRVRHEDFSLGAPSLQGGSYGDRSLSLKVWVEGNKDAALARQAELARLLV